MNRIIGGGWGKVGFCGKVVKGYFIGIFCFFLDKEGIGKIEDFLVLFFLDIMLVFLVFR